MQRWILIRGLAREAAHWQGFDVRLSRAMPQSRIEAHDLAGMGSEWRRRSPRSLRRITDDLRRRVEASPDSPVVLVTISLGGMVGIDWLSRAPGEVAGLVVINSSLRRFSPLFHRMRPTAYATVLRAMAESDRDAREALLLGLTSNARGTDAEVLHDWCAIQQQRPARVTAALTQLWAASRFAGPRELPAGPLLFLGSRADRLVDPRCTAALHRAYGGEIAWHPDTGHDLPLDDPAWASGEIQAWAERHGLGAPSGGAAVTGAHA